MPHQGARLSVSIISGYSTGDASRNVRCVSPKATDLPGGNFEEVGRFRQVNASSVVVAAHVRSG
jgi:hypothetical protein